MSRISLPRSPTWDWWHERNPSLPRDPGNYTFPCEFHNEVNGEALSLRVMANRQVIAHCFGACGDDFWARVKTIFDGGTTDETPAESPLPPHIRPLTLTPGVSLSPIEELSQYTGVSVEFLRTLDLKEVGGALEFTWPGKKVVKTRPLPYESKAFSWAPAKTFNPPLWPTVPNELPEDIVITEGETDCIVIRSLDVPAFALTKGGGTKVSSAIFSELKKRGARTIFLVPDVDEAGRMSAAKLTHEIEQAELEVRIISLGKHVRIMDGEKDLRALYLRVGRDGLVDILEEGFLNSLSGSIVPMKAKDVLAQTIDVDWLAPGLVARGSMTLLSGQPKAGKTTLMMKLCGSFLRGDSFLNRVCQPARVLLLTENRSAALQEKLKLLPPDPDHVYVVDRYRRELLDLSWEDTVRVLFEVARGHGIDVIVLDTFMAWAMPEDENSSTEILQALDPLSRAVERTNIALVIVHHLNKDGTSPRGSGAFQAECDTIVNLTHAKGGARRLSIVSNIIREPVDDLIFAYDGQRYTIVEDVEDPMEQAILAALEVLDRDCTLLELVPELDPPYNTRSPDTIRLRLAKLVDAGRVVEVPGLKVTDPKTYRLNGAARRESGSVEIRRV